MTATFKVEITPSAEVDISAIWDYIALDDFVKANVFLNSIGTQIKQLIQFPERCPLIAENAILGTKYRHLLHDPYRVIFRISRDTVVILRVIHGARLLNDEFFSN